MLAEVAGCSSVWLIAGAVQFSVCERAHTQCSVVFAKAFKKCMRTLPQMCAHVVFAIGSEDFTVFRTLSSQCSVCVYVCMAFLPCDCSTVSEQDASQLLAYNVVWTTCHMGLAFLM